MGSDERHFNVSYLWGTKSQDSVHRPQLLKRKESQSRFKPRSELLFLFGCYCAFLGRIVLCFQTKISVVYLNLVVWFPNAGSEYCFRCLFFSTNRMKKQVKNCCLYIVIFYSVPSLFFYPTGWKSKWKTAVCRIFLIPFCHFLTSRVKKQVGNCCLHLM